MCLNVGHSSEQCYSKSKCRLKNCQERHHWQLHVRCVATDKKPNNYSNKTQLNNSNKIQEQSDASDQVKLIINEVYDDTEDPDQQNLIYNNDSNSCLLNQEVGAVSSEIKDSLLLFTIENQKIQEELGRHCIVNSNRDQVVRAEIDCNEKLVDGILTQEDLFDHLHFITLDLPFENVEHCKEEVALPVGVLEVINPKNKVVQLNCLLDSGANGNALDLEKAKEIGLSGKLFEYKVKVAGGDVLKHTAFKQTVQV